MKRMLEHTNAMHTIRDDGARKNRILALWVLALILLALGLNAVEKEKIPPMSTDEVTR